MLTSQAASSKARRATNDAVMTRALGRAAERTIGSAARGWQFSRWRQFVGRYDLPALPDPAFVVHIAGKPRIKTWQRGEWSRESSVPGCATIIPAGQATSWLVDGELDVVTLSLSLEALQTASARDRFERFHFAFADPLGVALARQILAELYAPATAERMAHIDLLVTALNAHVARGVFGGQASLFPTSDFAAYRLHRVMNAVLNAPEAEHSLDSMASSAGLTSSHFCRIFKRATGTTPHRYVMNARLNRAQELLCESDVPIAAIADRLGFTSQSHFTRAFQRHSSLTPSGWRRAGR